MVVLCRDMMVAFLDFFSVVNEESKGWMDVNTNLCQIPPAANSSSQALVSLPGHNCSRRPTKRSDALVPLLQSKPNLGIKEIEGLPVLLHANSFLAQYVRRHIKQCQRKERRRTSRKARRWSTEIRDKEESKRDCVTVKEEEGSPVQKSPSNSQCTYNRVGE